MNIERAIDAISNATIASPSERLRAARYISRNATLIERDQLTALHTSEQNSWVKQALRQAIQRSRSQDISNQTVIFAPDEGNVETSTSQLYEEIHADATAETSAFFLHELRPRVGLIEHAASDELSSYSQSNTKQHIDRIKDLLSAIERLRIAAEPAQSVEFDLTEVVSEVVDREVIQYKPEIAASPIHPVSDPAYLNIPADEITTDQAKIVAVRDDPVVTIGDPTLVDIVLTNTLTNAIEAVLEKPIRRDSYVVISWGTTDFDTWISILDDGCGLPHGIDRVTEPGVTTKSKTSGHFGMGLAIAHRAITTMTGTMTLSPRSSGGAACHVRWPRDGISS